uniref:protein smoothened n=1 Tax=Myxine glutinosa TaxID=7769 RepID=UPI00358FFE9D
MAIVCPPWAALPAVALTVCCLLLGVCAGARGAARDGPRGREGSRFPPPAPGPCAREAECHQLQETTCLGATLPYTTTSLVLSDAHSQDNALAVLGQWTGLRGWPRCWVVLAPLLCAVYLPACGDGRVALPSHATCQAARQACEPLVELGGGPGAWPKSLDCDGFPSDCTQPLPLRFNISENCVAPLILSEDARTWLGGVPGCAEPCTPPLFFDHELLIAQAFLATAATLALLSTLFALATFAVDWRRSRRQPAVFLFYINACCAGASACWLTQFAHGARQDIVCQPDGTSRIGEPNSRQAPSCVLVFVGVYFSLLAAAAWLVLLARGWLAACSALGRPRPAPRYQLAQHHLLAWSLPFALTVAALASAQVDGDYISGICFVGYRNLAARTAFVLLPIGLAAIGAGFFIIRGVVSLCRLRSCHPSLLSPAASRKLTLTILRLVVFAVLVAICVFGSFVCHVIEYSHHDQWERALLLHALCVANGNERAACPASSRRPLALPILHLACAFVAALLMSSWVWTRASILVWRRALCRLLGRGDPVPKRLRKSHMIAKAFARRRDILQDPALELSLSTRSGGGVAAMELGLEDSEEMDSGWMHHMNKMVARRGAILPQELSGDGPRDSSSSPKHKRRKRRKPHHLPPPPSYPSLPNETTTALDFPRRLPPIKMANKQKTQEEPVPRLPGCPSDPESAGEEDQVVHKRSANHGLVIS